MEGLHQPRVRQLSVERSRFLRDLDPFTGEAALEQGFGFGGQLECLHGVLLVPSILPGGREAVNANVRFLVCRAESS
jgi:hypothetical protein